MANETISTSHAFSPSPGSNSSGSPTNLTPQIGHTSIFPAQNSMYNMIQGPQVQQPPVPTAAYQEQQLQQQQQQQHQQQQQQQQQQQLQQQHQHQQVYQAEPPPGIFALENYYWNDFQVAANSTDHPGQPYVPMQNNELNRIQTPQMANQVPVTGVYYNVIRLLQEEGRLNQ